MTQRKMHFVGTLPEGADPDPAAGMRWVLKHSEDRELTAMPSDLDRDWIVDYCRRLADREALEVRVPGVFAGYDDFPTYRVVPGRALTVDDVAMDRADRVRERLAVWREIRAERADTRNLPLLVSQPHPVDMALFAFAAAAVGPGLPVKRALRNLHLVAYALAQLEVFEDAVAAEMTELTDEAGRDLLWQVESPVSTVAVQRAASVGLLAPVARAVGSALARGLDRMPVHARVILHLCHGDYRHEALYPPTSLRPMVALLNATGRRLRSGIGRARAYGMPPVHLPAASGATPPPTDQPFYNPLRRLHPGWEQLVAGVAAGPAAGLRESGLALMRFEHAAERSAYAVGAACGLGRTPLEDAVTVTESMSYVAAIGANR